MTSEPDEQEPFRTLRREIDDYWRIINAIIHWTPQERNRRRLSFFYDDFAPRRTAMLQIADRIAAVNELGLRRSEVRSAAAARNLERSLTLTFAGTLFGGVVLALLTIGFTLRLERELDLRRADLQELSTLLLRAPGERTPRSGARASRRNRPVVVRHSHGDRAPSVPNSSVSTRDHLKSIRGLAEKTVNQVRDLALLLRPSMLDDLGLVPALNWHARETSKRTSLNVSVNAGDEMNDLPEDHRTCIYRIVQEAVNNAVRHANARVVLVSVRKQRQTVIVTVQDDGSGFDTRFLRGLGLLGMEERVRRLGGQLKINSESGRGTLVQAELPVTELDQRIGTDGNSYLVG